MSIYEKILNLPLFKGLSTVAIERFVTKTPISFYKCSVGESIVKRGSRCDSIKFILSGTAKVERIVFNGQLKVTESIGENSMIGAERLYGIETNFDESIKVIENCSLMEFSKKHFLNLLKEDNFILINYLNYLSKEVQKPIISFKDYNIKSPVERLKLIIELFTRKKASEISIESIGHPLYDLLGFTSNKEFLSSLGILLGEGIVNLKSENQIVITSRREVLDRIQ